MRRDYTVRDELMRMQEQMDSLFSDFFTSSPLGGRSQGLIEYPSGRGRELAQSNFRMPVSDIYETDKEVVAEIEMPGISKKDIQVNVAEDSIEVRAEKKSEKKDEDRKKGMYRFERNYSGFCRQFSLPANVDANKAVAEYRDGMLKITVPKLRIEEKKKKLLEVK